MPNIERPGCCSRTAIAREAPRYFWTRLPALPGHSAGCPCAGQATTPAVNCCSVTGSPVVSCCWRPKPTRSRHGGADTGASAGADAGADASADTGASAAAGADADVNAEAATDGADASVDVEKTVAGDDGDDGHLRELLI